VDEDYGFDDGYGDPSDYGVTDFDDATQAGFDVSGVTSSDFSTGDSAEDYNSAIMGQTPLQAVETFSGPRGVADYILNQTGNRSNIRNAVNYDPLYAQALNISRGVLPGNQVIGFYPTASQFQGQQDLTIPMDMRPTISGRAGKFGPQYYSGVEKFLQEDAPELVKSAMNMGIGGLLNKFTSTVSSTENSAKEAISGGKKKKKNSFDGLSLEDINKSVSDAVSNLVPNRVETDTNPMNMPMAAIRDEVPKVSYGEDKDGKIPMGFTFGSMPEQTMNTGIAGLSSAPVTVDRLNPIVQEIQDPSSQLPTEEDRAKRDFARDVFQAFPNQREKQFGSQDSFNQNFIDRTLNQPKPNFDDEGFIKLIGGSGDPRNSFLTSREQLPVAGRVIIPSDNMPFRNLASDNVMADFDLFKELNKSKREEDLYGRTIAENELEI